MWMLWSCDVVRDITDQNGDHVILKFLLVMIVWSWSCSWCWPCDRGRGLFVWLSWSVILISWSQLRPLVRRNPSLVLLSHAQTHYVINSYDNIFPVWYLLGLLSFWNQCNSWKFTGEKLVIISKTHKKLKFKKTSRESLQYIESWD